ncbi:MAG: pentapeptide repeat-containing protein [bacterium]|nr:pentapeptide repeat-containing protein [bacterium]
MRATRFSAADLGNADLSNANLSGADLGAANLIATNLSGAIFADVDLTNTIYEPLTAPAKGGLGNIEGILTIRFRDTKWNLFQQTVPVDFISNADVSGLVLLRNALKDVGLREREREATFVIERQRTRDAPRIEQWSRRVAFDWTSGYGLYPARPLWIMGGFFGLCSLIYMLHLARRGTSGLKIFRVWPEGRIEGNAYTPVAAEKAEVEPLQVWGWAIVGYGLYFSLLSTFHFGWRDLNVGSWIARIQPRQYALRATGSMRVVSGVQSLLSIYLVALWVLTYFGRPFQ